MTMIHLYIEFIVILVFVMILCFYQVQRQSLNNIRHGAKLGYCHDTSRFKVR